METGRVDSRDIISDYIFNGKYSRTLKNGKKETWEESVERVLKMHTDKYWERMKADGNEEVFEKELEKVRKLYKEKRILGAQRGLQYAGKQLFKHNSRIYNCSASYLNRIDFFEECAYLLLSGAGTGYSVQKKHISQLPIMKGVNREREETFVIPDKIEGWARAIGLLINSYYHGLPLIKFDYSKIRPKGAHISGGFKAPGPIPLENCLNKISSFLDKIKDRKLSSFELHYITCMIADAVISGGIRRSAMICLFDLDDQEMMTCKTGNWFYKYPELCRCNNSVVILPDCKKEKYDKILKSIKTYGEPGIIFLDNQDYVYNPCCFTGETLVAIADGRNAVSIKELAEEDKPSLFYYKNKRGKVCITKGKAFCTGEKHVIELILSNGSSFRCTPDHPLQRADGNYVTAVESIGVELSKFYSSKSEAKEDSSYPTETIYVVDIVDNNETEEVYDIEMDCEEHNFAIITKGDNNYGNSEGIFVHNCEVGMFPQIKTETGTEYGWSFCNLSEINGAKIKTEQDFYDACEGAAILGTLQAGWTKFKVLSEASKKIAERDALIGVGITGMSDAPNILFDERIQRKGAAIVKETNERIAALLHINPAARTTVIKPSGNSSQLLGCSSGIHAYHYRKYIRNIQAADTEQTWKEMVKENPDMVSPSVYNPKGEKVLSFPIELPEDLLVRTDHSTIDFLKRIYTTKMNWIEFGTNFNHPSYKENPSLRMNVSCTVSVKQNEWEEVFDWIWEHREGFCGVSFLSEVGELDYPQAPYMSYLNESELTQKYGVGAILSSGLIVDALNVFNHIWEACDTARGRNEAALVLTNEDISSFITQNIVDGKFLINVDGVYMSDVNAVIDHLKNQVESRIDWVRRFKKFADNYFEGDLDKTSNCLKHVNIFHHWQKLKKIKAINWNDVVWEDNPTEAGEQVGTACAGGACDI